MSALPAAQLQELLSRPGILTMPCCYDALTARLIERAGFDLTFMSGFSVSAARLAVPDAGLISFAEMVDQGRNICQAVSFPVIGDGDTGYGNAVNVKRTVWEYARAGMACVMIEDQQWPKRCGHVAGKSVVGFDEACARIRAAVDARDELREQGGDILIMARTDARGTDGLDEGLRRVKAFSDIGADILFMEAPRTIEEMRACCEATDKPSMANMLEGGVTPCLPPEELLEIGYKIAAYPLTLQLALLPMVERVLDDLKHGRTPENLASFDELKDVVGFPAYNAESQKYA